MLAFSTGEVPSSIIEAFDEFGAVYRRETVSELTTQGQLSQFINDGGATVASGPQTPQAQPSCGISLDRLSPTEAVELSFDTDRLGAPHDLPERVTVQMLPGGREVRAESGEITVDCLGANALPDGRDLYVQMRESAYTATPVEIAVSIDGHDWELAPTATVTVTQSTPARSHQPIVQ